MQNAQQYHTHQSQPELEDPPAPSAFSLKDFEEVSSSTWPASLLISSQGEEDCGKTHFALTAPGPIFYIGTGRNGEGVVVKAVAGGKKVYRHKVPMPTVRNSKLAVAQFIGKLVGFKAAIFCCCEFCLNAKEEEKQGAHGQYQKNCC